MATLCNEIIIDALIEKVWEALSKIEELEKYDPTVKRSRALTPAGSGIGAIRKVDMKDGKNWFEEKVTIWKQNDALTYELTACSFPIQQLKHGYRFEQIGYQTKVSQVMEYKVKYGLIGKILDALMIRKQSDAGIKKFFAGLKSYIEKQ
jgi:ribosome-associated toxin RatA of RatAB toxin-antitoxin module